MLSSLWLKMSAIVHFIGSYLLHLNYFNVYLSTFLPAQFFPQSCSGQSLYETLRDSEKNPRLQSCEGHTRNCRNSKHNCSTQTDICSCDFGSRGEEACKDTGDSLNSSSGSTHSHHKPFSSGSPHSRSFSASHSPSEPHPEFCYRRQDLQHRPFTFTPLLSDCSSPQAAVDRVQSSPVKPSGGTWPKVIVGTVSEYTQLSIYKKPKQRKSIFDMNAFRRPDAAQKLDYMSLSHSPQSSVSESAQTPPTPPARSDSFRFKHRQQNSSASDSTITTGTPPASPAQATNPKDKGEVGNQCYFNDGPPGEAKGSSKKPAEEEEEEENRYRTEVQGKKRYRPKSAPALRRNVTPLHIPVPIQVTEYLKNMLRNLLFDIFIDAMVCVILCPLFPQKLKGLQAVRLLLAGTEFL